MADGGPGPEGTGGGGGSGTGTVTPSVRNLSGVTTDGYVALFTDAFTSGMLGIGTIKNTGGVNSLKVRETVTDAFGTIDATTETIVAPGADYMLDPQTNFGAARPPYVSYTVEVKANSAGNQTTFSLRSLTEGQL